MARRGIPEPLLRWIEARRRHHLSHAHVQMARELGFNPRKLGKLDNHRQEPWKLPLPRFIERLYLERFGKERPDVVRSVEEHVHRQRAKKAARRAAKAARQQGGRGLSAALGTAVAPPGSGSLSGEGAAERPAATLSETESRAGPQDGQRDRCDAGSGS